jgi:hypothetical protein
MQAGALWTEEQLALYGGGKGGGRSWFHFEMKGAVDSNNRPSRALKVVTIDSLDKPDEIYYVSNSTRCAVGLM